MYRDRKIGRGLVRGRDHNGTLENLWEMIYMFIILTVAMVSQLYTYVRTCERVYSKYFQVIIIQLYLNKVVKLYINKFN